MVNFNRLSFYLIILLVHSCIACPVHFVYLGFNAEMGVVC